MSFESGKKRYFKNLIFAYLPYFAQIVSTIVLTPLYVKFFGQEKYAIFVILHTVIGYFMLSNIGLPQAFSRQIIHLKEQNEHHKIGKILSSILFYYSIVIIVVLSINSFVFYGNLFDISNKILNSSNIQYIQIFGLGMVLVSLKFAISLITDVFQSLIDATNRLDISNTIRFMQITLLGIFSFVALESYGTIEAVLISNILSALFIFFVMFFVARKFLDSEISFFDAKFKYFKMVLPSGFWYFMGGISVAIITQIDTLVISFVVGLQMVAIYSLMFKFSEVFRNLISTAVNVLFSQVAYNHSKNEMDKIRQNYKKFSLIILFLSIFVGVFLYFIGYDIFVLWIGRQNAGSLDLFLWFIIYLVLFSINQVSALFVNALNKHKAIVLMSFVQAGLNFGLSIWLLSVTGDIKWVIISTILSLLVTNFWFNIYYFKKISK